jgi:hypothetical protein
LALTFWSLPVVVAVAMAAMQRVVVELVDTGLLLAHPVAERLLKLH